MLLEIYAGGNLMSEIVKVFLSYCVVSVPLILWAGSAPFAQTDAGLAKQVTGSTQQTFESCPRKERPCGPVCMPKDFSCCSKETGTICPPGKSCCGSKCGCGPCQTCKEGVCVPKPNCVDEQASKAVQSGVTGTQTAATGSAAALTASMLPPALFGGLVILGTVVGDGDSNTLIQRRPPSP